MKLILYGSRFFDDYEKFKLHVDSYIRNVDRSNIEIVSGGCSTGTGTYTRPDGKIICGADGMAERYAKENNLPIKIFEADWSTHGVSAGPIRNSEMSEYGTRSLGFKPIEGRSNGTDDMTKKVKKKGINGALVRY